MAQRLVSEGFISHVTGAPDVFRDDDSIMVTTNYDGSPSLSDKSDSDSPERSPSSSPNPRYVNVLVIANTPYTTTCNSCQNT